MFHQAVNHFQGGGFAGARCANQHRKTPFLKIEIEIVNGFLCAEQFADMAKMCIRDRGITMAQMELVMKAAGFKEVK